MERCNDIEQCVGNITFTEFKQKKSGDLMKHLRKELESVDLAKYAKSKEIVRFSRPYWLRAQNGQNLTGYGWEWDWSGGYGSYTEGTFYGETTDYAFIGIYVVKGYPFARYSKRPIWRLYDYRL